MHQNRIKMDGVTAKVRSTGFVSYVPPGRRTLDSEVRAQKTEKESSNVRHTSTIQPKDISAEHLSTFSLLKSSDLVEKELSKTAKVKCLEISREYIPPGRRAHNPELQKHRPEQSKSLEIAITSIAIVELAESSADEQIVGVKDHTLDEDKITKKARKIGMELPRGNYIPPARRALMAEELRLDAEAEASGIKRIPKIVPKKCEGFIIPPITQQFYEENIIQDEYSVRKCSFIVRGLPPELPDYSKDRYLKSFCDRGAIVRWISPDEAILVFPTETIAKAAMITHRNSLLQIVSLQTLEEIEVCTYLSISTEMYNCLKPERDCRVANRMISAALGISLPKRVPQGNQLPSRAKSPKKLDAWDD